MRPSSEPSLLVSVATRPSPRGPALAARGFFLLLGVALTVGATPSAGLAAVAVSVLWIGVVTPGAWCLARRRRPERPELGRFAVAVDILGVVALVAASGGDDSPVRWLLATTPLLCVYSNPRCLWTVIAGGAVGYGAIVLAELAAGRLVQGPMVAGFFVLYLAVSAVAMRMRVLRSSESRLQRSLRRVRTDVVGEHLDRERRYAEDLIARLHDGPIQLVLCAAQDLGDHLDDEPTDLVASRAMLLEAVGEIRALNETRFQAVLDDAGLAAALRAAADTAGRRGGPPTSVNVGTGTGGEHDATVIAAVGELLRNVAKHARASRGSVVVSRDQDGTLRVVVCDDGVGMADGPASASRPGHTGLRFLTRHVEELGGALRITDLGPGTRTEIRLPRAPDDAARTAATPTHGRIGSARRRSRRPRPAAFFSALRSRERRVRDRSAR